MAEAKPEKQLPLLSIAQDVHEYTFLLKTLKEDTPELVALKQKILDQVLTEQMADYYVQICATHHWEIDHEKVSSMKLANELKLKELDASIEESIRSAGETEVLDGIFNKARFLSQIGEFQNAYLSYDEILKKNKISMGKKIDATMEKARISLFLADLSTLKTHIADAKALIDKGGDWDRRNRLKVYEGLYFLLCRELKKAAELFLDCIATFNCAELLTYEHFMFFAVVTNIMSLDRMTLHKKIISNPEVISVVAGTPDLRNLMHTIYNCDYEGFFKTMFALNRQITHDRYIGPHSTFIYRELRVYAYAQFLEAYRSVLLSSMAKSFGIPTDYLDLELSRFIASGRLSAKIDKVGDIVETTRPDMKNLQYQGVIKRGDALLNRIQKLARVINV